MDEMQALAEEQRKAGLLLDDGAPVKLNVSLPVPTKAEGGGKDNKAPYSDRRKMRKRPIGRGRCPS
jgi:hypothetical protein